MLSIRQLYVQYQTRSGVVNAVNGIDLDIAPGETVALVGESGCGKSATCLAVMGLLPADSGRITTGSIQWEGNELTGMDEPDLRRLRGDQMAMVFQDTMTALNPYLRIQTQLLEGFIGHQTISRGDAKSRAMEMLKRVGLRNPDRIFRSYPHQLSGGMRQRVQIAMSLLCNPKVLIADEPTTALDVSVQKQILSLLAELRDSMNLAMLVVSHDLGVVANVADRIAVMHKGDIVEAGLTKDILNKPTHEYTRSLLNAVPRITPKSEQAATSDPISLQIGAQHESDGVSKVRAQGEVPLMDCQSVVKEFKSSFLSWSNRSVVRALDGVDMAIHDGEIVGLVGESGCGKSTLARLLVGLETPMRGRVLFDGQNTADLSAAQVFAKQKAVQLIFQDPRSSLNPRMTAAELISEPMYVHSIGNGKESRAARTVELMERVGLEPSMRFRYPHEFSGGQCQRIGIARALATQPRLLICDEAVSALDVSIQSQIIHLLRSLCTDLGMAMLFISHDLAVVHQVSDRIVVMQSGKIVEQGSADRICLHPQHPHTQMLVSCIPAMM